MSGWDDPFADVQAAIDSFAEDPLKQRVMLVRLAMHLNNGDEHFDHDHPDGYSWLCLRCAATGRGGLNGWAGALHMLAAAARERPLARVAEHTGGHDG